MIALALLPGALAQEARMEVACDPQFVAALVPELDATGVPTDAVISAYLLGDCGAPEFYDVLVTDDDGNVVADEQIDGVTLVDRLVVDPGPLAPLTRYHVTITPGNGWGQVTESAFTTGSEASPPLDGQPGAAFQTLGFDPRGDRVSALIALEPTDDPAGPGWITARADDGFTWGGGVTPAAAVAQYVLDTRRAPDEVCVVPVQIRANGEEIEGQRLCDEPQRAEGPLACSTTASPTSLWPLALLLLARRRK